MADKWPQRPHCLVRPSILSPPHRPEAAKHEAGRRGRLSRAHTPIYSFLPLYPQTSPHPPSTPLVSSQFMQLPLLNFAVVLCFFQLASLCPQLDRNTVPRFFTGRQRDKSERLASPLHRVCTCLPKVSPPVLRTSSTFCSCALPAMELTFKETTRAGVPLLHVFRWHRKRAVSSTSRCHLISNQRQPGW